MSEINYKHLLLSAPFGYAYHRIVLNDDGKPCDYAFVEANDAFGKLTGLDVSRLEGRCITELFPSIINDTFDWIGFYGQIALNGGEKVFEQFSEHIGRWYKVHAYSNEKMYFATTFVDITEEKNKSAELENFFNINLDLLCIADLQGNFIKVNKEWERMLGYKAEELQAQKFLQFVHPDDVAPTLEAMSKLGNNETVLQFVNRYRASDGSYRHIEWRSYPHGNEIYAAARDISQRIVYEQSIKESVGYINALLNAIPDMIFVISADGHFEDFKVHDENRVNVPLEYFWCKHYSEVLPAEACSKFTSNIDRVRNGFDSVPFEFTWQLASEMCNYECKIVPFGEDKTVAIVRDVSEKYKVEEALKTTISQLSAAMDATADGILIVGKDMQIVRWNKKFEELWQFPQSVLDSMHDGRLPDVVMLNSVADKIKDRSAFIQLVNEIYALPDCSRYDLIELADGRFFERYTQPQSIGNEIVGRVWSFRDVSAAKNAEHNLLLEKERFELAVNGSNDGIWDWDVKNDIFYMSETFKEQIGYSGDELPYSIDTVYSRLHPEDAQRVQRQIDDYLIRRTAPFCDVEYRLRHKDGSYRWVRSRSKAIWGSDGAVMRMAGSHTDITERRQLEATVALSERNFRTFYESMDALIFIIDTEGVVLEANPTALSILGYEWREMVGTPFVRLHEVLRQDEAYRICNEAIKGKRATCSVPLQTKEGGIIPVETRISYGQWNSQPCMFAVCKDMRNEEESQQRFNVIFENNPALMTISTMDLQLITVNESFRKLTGYSDEELLGKRPKELSLFIENEVPSSAIDLIFRDKQVRNVEMKLRTKYGNVITVLYSGELLRSQGQKYYLSVMVDITAQKEAEAVALKASQAKSEFLANMSHEIRTPLNGVIGFTELIKNTSMTQIQKQYIDNAYVSAHSLLSIINDILDLSKIEAGKIELDIITADIIELAENAIDIVKLQANRKNLELLLNISPDLPRYADIDPQRFRQVLVNLLGNAVKFTEQGEVELKLEFRPEGQDRGVFTVQVRDTGIGISEEQRPKLFRAFSQGDTSTTRKYGGTGLGLVISNLIAEKMGTHIELESTFGKGSTFTISFGSAYKREDVLSSGKLPHINKVLVVDDNANNRMILARTLAGWGVDAICCESGHEALSLVDMYAFDVLIVDQQMPVLDGIETIRLIKQKQFQPAPSVFLLYSSSDDESIRTRSAELGVRFSLVKPVKAQDLFSYLNNIGTDSYVRAVSPVPVPEVQSSVVDRNPYTILIAEDVMLNMVLAIAMVKQLLPNAEIVSVVNGQEARDYLARSSADIVFMDVQMPVLDGMEATRQIRAAEAGSGFHVPIIALSAGALNEEKAKCISAGMDDFLAKPLEFNPLSCMLKKYLQGTSDVSLTQDVSDEVASYDEAALLSRISNDMEMFAILKRSAKGISEVISSLAQAIASNDVGGIEADAHKIKGMSLNLSFNRLARIAKLIEERSTEGVEILSIQLAALRKEWEYLQLTYPQITG